MAVEATHFPPDGVEYSFINPEPKSLRLLRSPIKGYYGRFRSSQHDLIEAVLSPIDTHNRWIYSCESLPAAAAFNFLGCPLPRVLRAACLRHLFLRDNCRKLVFWSYAGRATLKTYRALADDLLGTKVTVVYPAVRSVPDSRISFRDTEQVSLLFSGDFFRKGGVNVVDAFERVQHIYPSVRLVLCCDERIDFNTPNAVLKSAYLQRIRTNPSISMRGRIPRAELLTTVLPETDIYLLPTYAETFGMSILEAMAFGIPVIATNHFAIPEILTNEQSGLLIDTQSWNSERLFRGYVVNTIPADFSLHITQQLVARLIRLIESPKLRREIGLAGLAVARSKFSFETRNRRMLAIYQDALR